MQKEVDKVQKMTKPKAHKYSVFLPQTLADRVNDYARDMHITKSSAINLLVTKGLNVEDLARRQLNIIHRAEQGSVNDGQDGTVGDPGQPR